MDIGIILMGFEVVDVVGGLVYSNSWNYIGWIVMVLWWLLFSLLLVFVGMCDFNINVIWGGVCVNGVSLGVSYDWGEVNGVWSDLSYYYLIG